LTGAEGHWTSFIYRLTREADFAPWAAMVSLSLAKLMGMTGEEWDEFSRASAARGGRRVARSNGNRLVLP